MVIVVTGMVGVDKKCYLEKVCECAQSVGMEVTVCNIGDMMYAEATDIRPGGILDIPLKRLHAIRRSVFKDVIAKAKTAENLIVNTHATFRWRHGLFPAVDFDQMRQLDADMYICIIDGVAALHGRLLDEHDSEHTLKDLVVWREEEIIGTEMLCKGIDDKLPLYCLARGIEEDTAQTCYQLIFGQGQRKAYLSFPMTHVAEQPEILKQIEDFRHLMKEHFICFDPGDLEEAFLPGHAHQAKEKGQAVVEMQALGRTVKLDVEEVLQIERDINSQIYARDFLLIDQADMIISFIPAMPDGRAAISSGVERELQHAHESAKEVIVIWTAEKPPSVFVTQTATKVFKSTGEAMAYFQSKGYMKKGTS